MVQTTQRITARMQHRQAITIKQARASVMHGRAATAAHVWSGSAPPSPTSLYRKARPERATRRRRSTPK